MKWLWAWLMSLFTAVSPVATPAPSLSPALNLVGQFRYEQAAVKDVSRLKLGSNLAERLSAADLKQKHRCEFLVNAGFYDTSNRHLGWLQVSGRELSPRQNNRLFDGYLSIVNGRAELGFQPLSAANYGLQSGPMLIYDGKPLKLTIKDDQPRRRVVAARTNTNQLIFMVILSPESNYAGPLLAETPKLVLKLNPNISAALNLDGGSASAFLSEAVFLEEYSPIGGYFCYTGL